MATLKTIQAQNKVLEEKIPLDFEVINGNIIYYTLTSEIFAIYEEAEKEIKDNILKKVGKELSNTKGIKTNGNLNQVLAIALENLGEEYLEKITNEIKIKRAESLVFSFDKSPTKEEIIEFFKNINKNEDIVNMFYANFMLTCYKDFSDLIIKFKSMEDNDKVGK